MTGLVVWLASAWAGEPSAVVVWMDDVPVGWAWAEPGPDEGTTIVRWSPEEASEATRATLEQLATGATARLSVTDPDDAADAGQLLTPHTVTLKFTTSAEHKGGEERPIQWSIEWLVEGQKVTVTQGAKPTASASAPWTGLARGPVSEWFDEGEVTFAPEGDGRPWAALTVTTSGAIASERPVEEKLELTLADGEGFQFSWTAALSGEPRGGRVEWKAFDQAMWRD